MILMTYDEECETSPSQFGRFGGVVEAQCVRERSRLPFAETAPNAASDRRLPTTYRGS